MVRLAVVGQLATAQQVQQDHLLRLVDADRMVQRAATILQAVTDRLVATADQPDLQHPLVLTAALVQFDQLCNVKSIEHFVPARATVQLVVMVQQAVTVDLLDHTAAILLQFQHTARMAEATETTTVLSLHRLLQFRLLQFESLDDL